jgi:ABC-type sugar transport system substrate-binding protein
MKHAKLVLCVLLALMVIPGAVFAGGSKDSSTGKSAEPVNVIANSPLAGKRIGVAHITFYDEWCKGVYDDFVKLGKEYGVAEMNIQNGDINAEIQQRQVEDFITQKYDIIFIDPVNPDGIQATLDKAQAAGIPVIAFDSGTSWAPLISHIAWDHAETGRVTGRYAAEYAKKNLGGKARVGVLAMLDAPHTAIRSQTFKEAIEEGLGKANVTLCLNRISDRLGKAPQTSLPIISPNRLILSGVRLITPHSAPG